MPFRRVAILGPGLIGGSLALAWKASHPDSSVSLWFRREEAARESGSPDATSDLAAALKDCDLAVFCTPAEALPDLAPEVLRHLPAQALVTDACSTKEKVTRLLSDIFGARYCGSHPMAGSEKSGFSAASATLYRGALCILTPTSQTDRECFRRIRALWESVGCRIAEMSPDVHDRIVARISHLPHLTASMLVLAACGEDPSLQDFAAGGYRDTTRVAEGPEAMWAGILLQNREQTLAALQSLLRQLESARAALESEDYKSLQDMLARARHIRSKFSHRHANDDV